MDFGYLLKSIVRALTRKERYVFFIACIVFLFSATTLSVLLLYEVSEYVGVEGGTLREGVYGQPVLINPILAVSEADQSLVGLLFYPVRHLIESLEIKENGGLYVLKMKEGLIWDNGQPLTSDDLVFTIKTIQEPLTKSPLKEAWLGVGVERISELQVNIKLPKPSLFFSERLKRLLLIPEHIYGRVPPANMHLSEYNLNPVGNGPFSFASFEKRKDGFIVAYNLKRNERFIGERSFIDHVRVQFYNRKEGVEQAFRVREVDAYVPSDPTRIESDHKDSELKILAGPRFFSAILNYEHPLLKKKEVRQALSKSLNRELLMSNVGGNGVVAIADALGRPASLNDEEDIILASSTEMFRLLVEKESGKLSGSSSITITVPDIGFLVRTAETLKSSWESIGIQSEVLKVGIEQVSTIAENRTFDVLIIGQILEHPLDIYSFWYSGEAEGGLNIAAYNDARVDLLLERIRKTDQTEKLIEMLEEVSSIIKEDAPAVFLYSLPYIYMLNDQVGGFGNASSTKDMYYISPRERFEGIEYWYVSKARVLKD